MTRQIPMLFQHAMVSALLDGTKTETRRQLKDQAADEPAGGGEMIDGKCFWLNGHDGSTLRPVKGAKCCEDGDLIWVKETHFAPGHWDETGTKTKTGRGRIKFVRDDAPIMFQHSPDLLDAFELDGRTYFTRPSLFMERRDSRLTLRVRDYRIERLHQIDEDGARKEGFPAADELDDNGNPARWSREIPHPKGGLQAWECARDWYADLWDDINGTGAWAANPWVEVIKFDVIERNVLEVAA